MYDDMNPTGHIGLCCDENAIFSLLSNKWDQWDKWAFFRLKGKKTPLVLTCSALSCLHIRNKTGTNRLRCTTNRAGKQKTVRRSVVLSQINCIHWVNKVEGNSRPGFHHVVFEEANRCRGISGWRRLLAVRSAARLNRQNRGILGCGLIFCSLPKLKDKLFDLETEGFAADVSKRLTVTSAHWTKSAWS